MQISTGLLDKAYKRDQLLKVPALTVNCNSFEN